MASGNSTSLLCSSRRRPSTILLARFLMMFLHSIGSLGKDGATQTVENISVSDSSVTDGLTGARIKTWQGGSGYVRGVVFEGMRVRSVQTPIMIDQFY
ncbi:hypothetical protein GW17_00005181 [Ensete ventricosum]|nr:hypothetical protein GW17_00005181 [Ensete ventricosum]